MPNDANTIRGSWLDWIKDFVGGLGEIYTVLVDAGLITSAEVEQGLSREELITLVDARLRAAEKPWYETWAPWLIAGGLGIGLLYVVWKK